jgi:hypothetical protein
MPGTHLLHATPHYATRRKCVQKFNKDLNALRTHLFHAIRQHATRRGTTYARSNRPDTRLFSKRVKACCPPSLLLQPRSRDFHTGSQVLPPDRKHPLLIDLKFSKIQELLCITVEHSVNISNFLMKRVNISF